ncbi:MAG: YraN family protein [Bryobacteraceae bacterium]|jgi:putative endonuclease
MTGWLWRAAARLRRRLQPDDIGRWGEDLAHRYLRAHGCTVVARNYRPLSGAGEIDLVVWHGETLAFVEVKTRASDEFAAPERNVGKEKQRRVLRAAADYLRRTEVPWSSTRFDIVSIVLTKPPKLEWMRGAFRRPG